MKWGSLPVFNGKIFADMASEILDDNNIPYYLKMDWASSAYNVTGTTNIGESVRIFVPKVYIKKASDLTFQIIEKSKE